MTDDAGPSKVTSTTNGASPNQASSNWKALRKTMPMASTSQGATPASKKRKRTSPEAVGDGSAIAHDGDFIRGSAPHTATKEALDDVKGKGKAVSMETILGGGKLVSKKTETGQYVSLDCEFVGIYDPANNHAEHSLARVSIVNYHGHVVLDSFVEQRERVGDWRTWVSGVRPEDVKNAPPFKEVQQKVADIIKGRILVGHAVHNDLKVLLLSHPHNMTRDTSIYGPLRELAGTKRPSLKSLASKALGIDIQQGEHSSVTDAQATMAVYRHVQKGWEAALKGGASAKTSKKAKLAAAQSNGKVTKAATIVTSRDKVKQSAGSQAKGGPAAGRKGGTLSLAATIEKHKEWWTSTTID